MPVARTLKIFMCYASEDKVEVRNLYHQLRACGTQPWLDEEDLLPGQDWDHEIRKVVRSSDAVLVCLSRRSTNKSGYLQKEIRLALDAAAEKPEGTIFLIPVRLEPADVPYSLRQWQWVDIFEGSGYSKLLDALQARADACCVSLAENLSLTQDGSPPSLDHLKDLVINSPKRFVRVSSLRRIALQFGSDQLYWLREIAYTAKQWASRREAIDQIIKLEPPGLVAWLKEMAENHPSQENRRHAIQWVVAREGVSSFTWLAERFLEDRSFWCRYDVSTSLRELSRGNEVLVIDDSKLKRLQAAVASENQPDIRSRLVGTLLNICSKESWCRSWFWELLGRESGSYYRAELLGSALYVWKDSDLLAQLEELTRVREPIAAHRASRIFGKFRSQTLKGQHI